MRGQAGPAHLVRVVRCRTKALSQVLDRAHGTHQQGSLHAATVHPQPMDVLAQRVAQRPDPDESPVVGAGCRPLPAPLRRRRQHRHLHVDRLGRLVDGHLPTPPHVNPLANRPATPIAWPLPCVDARPCHRTDGALPENTPCCVFLLNTPLTHATRCPHPQVVPSRGHHLSRVRDPEPSARSRPTGSTPPEAVDHLTMNALVFG